MSRLAALIAISCLVSPLVGQIAQINAASCPQLTNGYCFASQNRTVLVFDNDRTKNLPLEFRTIKQANATSAAQSVVTHAVNIILEEMMGLVVHTVPTVLGSDMGVFFEHLDISPIINNNSKKYTPVASQITGATGWFVPSSSMSKSNSTMDLRAILTTPQTALRNPTVIEFYRSEAQRFLGGTVTNPVIFTCCAATKNSGYDRHVTWSNNFIRRHNLTFVLREYNTQADLTNAILQMTAMNISWIAAFDVPNPLSSLLSLTLISWGFNPSADQNSQCFKDSNCDWPVVQYTSYFSRETTERLPESAEALLNLVYNREDINQMLRLRFELNDTSGKRAACCWMKFNPPNWVKARLAIDRKSCGQTCDWYGKCDLLNGICKCDADHANLVSGPQCNKTCPGSVLRKTMNISTFCNGNGRCHRGTCSCIDGYGEADCSFKFPLNQPRDSTIGAIWAFTSLLILIAFIAMAWTYYHAEKKIIKQMQWKQTIMFLVGIVVTLSANYFFVIPSNIPVCVFVIGLSNIGMSMIAAVVGLKAYRLAQIFEVGRKSLQVTMVTDVMLFQRLGIVLVIESGLLVGYTMLLLIRGSVISIYQPNIQRVDLECWALDASWLTTFIWLMALTKFIWCSTALYWAWRSRSAHPEFRETQCMMYGTFFGAFALVAVFLLRQVTTNRVIVRTGMTWCIIACSGVFILSLFWPKVKAIHWDAEGAVVDDDPQQWGIEQIKKLAFSMAVKLGEDGLQEFKKEIELQLRVVQSDLESRKGTVRELTIPKDEVAAPGKFEHIPSVSTIRQGSLGAPVSAMSPSQSEDESAEYFQMESPRTTNTETTS